MHAWWEGYELAEQASEPEPDPKQPAVQRPAEKGGPRPGEERGWTPRRIAIAQRLFGQGAVLPGNVEWIDGFINPLGLDETMSVVDLGTGVGTVARVIAKETGAWVDAVEPNALLAQNAQSFAKLAGLAKKAAVVNAPLDRPGVKDHSRDAVVSRESIYLVPDKKPVFSTMQKLLKPGGQLLLADFMSKTDAPNGPEFRAWAADEPHDPTLWSLPQTRKTLEGLGFDVRVAEEISNSYCLIILEALQEFAEVLKAEPCSDEDKTWLMWEIEIWARRIAALQAGEVGLFRIYASLPVPSE